MSDSVKSDVLGGTNEATYPEHVKLQAIAKESRAIGEFIEHSGYVLCKVDEHGRYYPPMSSVTEVLAEYFEIDMVKIEEEKRTMLAVLRGEI